MTKPSQAGAKLAKIAAPPVEADPLERVAAFDALGEPLTIELLRSMLLWEAGAKHAVAAMQRLAETVVDVNELRICLADEIALALGRVPMAEERAHRMKLVLCDVYNREHRVSLESLASEGKREAKVYLDSLDAIPPFVASRVLLVGLGGHAFPMDERLHTRLQAAGAVEDGHDALAAAGWAEREFRAGEALGAYFAVEAWSATARVKTPAASGSGTGSGRKKTKIATGKKPAKKSAKAGAKSAGKKAARKPARKKSG